MGKSVPGVVDHLHKTVNTVQQKTQHAICAPSEVIVDRHKRLEKFTKKPQAKDLITMELF